MDAAVFPTDGNGIALHRANGGVANREWLADPTMSSVIAGTVAMVGSPLLFCGCGVSRALRPSMPRSLHLTRS